ncbi:MAG: long-chain acyl-CoA synthetase, partial [Paracoccaceae bacterium]
MTIANNDYYAAQYPIDALATVQGLDVINTHDASTLDEAFRERVRRSSESIAYSQFNQKTDTWDSYSWAEIAQQVERWQVAFRESGLEKGDRVAICYVNSVEWVIFDQAALRLGLVVVPLYLADRADNVAYVIGNSGAKLVLFEDSRSWESVSKTDEDVSCIEHVLIFSGTAQNNVSLVDSWLPEHGKHFERGVASPDDLASIVYTSGTTGRPKGVMLSHRNMLANAYSGMRSVPLKPSDRLLSFLPLSHTLERTVGYYAALMSGSAVTFNRSIKELSQDILQVKPTVMVSVPRIFERIHNQIYSGLSEKSSFQQWIFRTAINIGWRRFEYQQGLQPWHPKLL